MAAQPLAVFGVKDHLDKTFGVSGSFGLATGCKGEFTHLDLISFFPGLFLGKAHRSDFGDTIGAAGDVSVIQGFYMHSGQFFHTEDPFGRGYVRQCLAGGYIAYGIVPGDVGLVKRIDLDFVLVGFDAYFFQAYIFYIGFDAHSRKYDIGLEYLFPFGGFHSGFHSVFGNFGLGYFR